VAKCNCGDLGEVELGPAPGSIPRISGWGSFLGFFAPTYDVTDVTRIRDVFRHVPYTGVLGEVLGLVLGEMLLTSRKITQYSYCTSQ
jgi:hypothetical protein